jgi:hypothetical protein
MSRLIKIGCGLVVGGALGLAASFIGLNAFGDGASSAASGTANAPAGRLSPAQLRDFADFPVYGGVPNLEGLPLLTANRTSPQLLGEAARRRPPMVTVGQAQGPESRGHRIVPDFVSLIYGSCPAAPSDANKPTPLCTSPLQVQIWRSCNRSLDDYEVEPGVAFPHADETIRGTEAADFGDRLEVYAGSVTIVIFAEPELARRAASALRPLNALAAAEASRASKGRLPTPSPGPDCA